LRSSLVDKAAPYVGPIDVAFDRTAERTIGRTHDSSGQFDMDELGCAPAGSRDSMKAMGTAKRDEQVRRARRDGTAFDACLTAVHIKPSCCAW